MTKKTTTKILLVIETEVVETIDGGDEDGGIIPPFIPPFRPPVGPKHLNEGPFLAKCLPSRPVLRLLAAGSK